MVAKYGDVGIIAMQCSVTETIKVDNIMSLCLTVIQILFVRNTFHFFSLFIPEL